MATDLDLLRRIDAYLDGVPRTSARAEEVGPFTLFVSEGTGWPFYARPTPGTESFTGEDVRAVRERQRELGQPEAIEWIVDVSPGVGPAASRAGMGVTEHPLMHLARRDFRPVLLPPIAQVRIASPQDDVATLHAVAALGFGAPGTEAGELGPELVPAAAAEIDEGLASFTGRRMAAELTVTAVATVDGRPVAVGSHNPLGDATEVVGVATLPTFRRRGLGGAVTSALVEDALARGIATVFLSAGDEAIARVYGRLGFRTIGAAGAAEPAGG
jgi:ribosomal protein S18 acetylase RimI-like enzyme